MWGLSGNCCRLLSEFTRSQTTDLCFALRARPAAMTEAVRVTLVGAHCPQAQSRPSTTYCDAFQANHSPCAPAEACQRLISFDFFCRRETTNYVQTRCIVKGKVQKNRLFWQFSGGFWFSEESQFCKNSTRKPLNLITDFYKHPL